MSALGRTSPASFSAHSQTIKTTFLDRKPDLPDCIFFRGALKTQRFVTICCFSASCSTFSEILIVFQPKSCIFFSPDVHPLQAMPCIFFRPRFASFPGHVQASQTMSPPRPGVSRSLVGCSWVWCSRGPGRGPSRWVSVMLLAVCRTAWGVPSLFCCSWVWCSRGPGRGTSRWVSVMACPGLPSSAWGAPDKRNGGGHNSTAPGYASHERQEAQRHVR